MKGDAKVKKIRWFMVLRALKVTGNRFIRQSAYSKTFFKWLILTYPTCIGGDHTGISPQFLVSENLRVLRVFFA